VERLCAAPAISTRLTVSGHVYDVVTGLVQTIRPAGWRDDQTVEDIHRASAPTARRGMGRDGP
jgi:predicted NAD-dependent protein-ADP-ribosyltransferase YbiA (DUF1768 family)